MTIFGLLIVLVLVVVCVREFRAPDRSYRHRYFEATRCKDGIEVHTNIPPERWYGLRGGDVVERVDAERWEVRTQAEAGRLNALNRACGSGNTPITWRWDGGGGGGDA